MRIVWVTTDIPSTCLEIVYHGYFFSPVLLDMKMASCAQREASKEAALSCISLRLPVSPRESRQRAVQETYVRKAMVHFQNTTAGAGAGAAHCFSTLKCDIWFQTFRSSPQEDCLSDVGAYRVRNLHQTPTHKSSVFCVLAMCYERWRKLCAKYDFQRKCRAVHMQLWC